MGAGGDDQRDLLRRDAGLFELAEQWRQEQVVRHGPSFVVDGDGDGGRRTEDGRRTTDDGRPTTDDRRWIRAACIIKEAGERRGVKRSDDFCQ